MAVQNSQQVSLLRQQEQQRLAEEQSRTSALTSEKQQLVEKLAALSRTVSGALLQKFPKVFVVNLMHMHAKVSFASHLRTDFIYSTPFLLVTNFVFVQCRRSITKSGP
jgi:hypothetical protein